MLQAAFYKAPHHLRHFRCCCSPSAAMSTVQTASITTSSPEDAEVRAITTPAGLGTITLCRDRQLNALGAGHVEALRAQLLAWCAAGSGVKAVLLDSNNERSFCSGGDVKAARQAVLDRLYPDTPPPGHHIHRVFESEYSTVLLTAAHPGLVACCQGIWMGFGFGIAGFAPHRVISDNTIFAMPENAIGLWPDVGFAFKAAHMQHHTGLFLGLSGVRITSASDLLHYGIGTHYIPQADLQQFKADLATSPDALQQLLQQYSRPAPDTPGPLQRLMVVVGPLMQQLVDAVHSSGCDELQALHTLIQQLQQELPVMRAVDHQAGELLHHAINGLQYASPRSLVITLLHFCRVRDAVLPAAAAGQGGQHNSSGGAGGCLPLPQPTWSCGVTVDGRGRDVPDLSTLQGTMQMEYRMAIRQVAHVDFIEGVRAALVDKDRRPAWLQHPPPSAAAAAAAAAVTAPSQQGHELTLSDAEVQAELQGGAGLQGPVSKLPGNRFSVQHLFSPLAG